jgi:hypothetical protein
MAIAEQAAIQAAFARCARALHDERFLIKNIGDVRTSITSRCAPMTHRVVEVLEN